MIRNLELPTLRNRKPRTPCGTASYPCKTFYAAEGTNGKRPGAMSLPTHPSPAVVTPVVQWAAHKSWPSGASSSSSAGKSAEVAHLWHAQRAQLVRQVQEELMVVLGLLEKAGFQAVMASTFNFSLSLNFHASSVQVGHLAPEDHRGSAGALVPKELPDVLVCLVKEE